MRDWAQHHAKEQQEVLQLLREIASRLQRERLQS